MLKKSCSAYVEQLFFGRGTTVGGIVAFVKVPEWLIISRCGLFGRWRKEI